MNKTIITSQDGSHTIYDEEIDEHYHSVFGAYTESQHIFIENGLNFSKLNPVKILEIGFGTGLNAFLALMESYKNNRYIIYDSIELFPLEMNIAKKLNYAKHLAPSFSSHFIELHSCEWNKQNQITKSFLFNKILGNVLEINFSDNYDVVFFDAFSPEKQPEMWDKKLFEKIYNVMNTGGVFTTYCAKGIVKRTLKETGFKVELLPGPPGKRHIIRALKERS